MTDDELGPEPPTSTDRLRPWSVAPDPADPPEWRHKLGYEDLVLRRRARAWLRAARPDWSDRLVDQQASFMVDRFNASRPSYREVGEWRSERAAWEARKAWIEGRAGRAVDLTRAELERLVEHFAGANDPIALSIAAKAAATLENRERAPLTAST